MEITHATNHVNVWECTWLKLAARSGDRCPCDPLPLIIPSFVFNFLCDHSELCSRWRIMARQKPPRPYRERRPDVPLRGDWYVTTTAALRFYELPPSQTQGHAWSGMSRCALQLLKRPLPPGTYVGPVHAVERTKWFISIQVPHPEDSGTLTWTNIWKPTLQLAHRVERKGLHDWFNQGWENVYICNKG